MHHAHVKRKEIQMNRYLIEEFHGNPALRHRLFENARDERSRAVRAGVAASLAWLRNHLPSLQPRAGGWLERIG
jgi:hypothetical protein